MDNLQPTEPNDPGQASEAEILAKKAAERERINARARENARKRRERDPEGERAKDRAKYQKNREAAVARQIRYQNRNRDKVNASRKRYYQENAELEKAKHKKWVEENRECVNEKQREYRQKNAEKFKEIDREHYRRKREKNIEHQRELGRIKAERRRLIIKTSKPEEYAKLLAESRVTTRKWAAINRDYVREYNKHYAQTPKGRAAKIAAQQRRDARKTSNGGDVSTKDWLRIINIFGNRCFYCFVKFSDTNKPTMDHMIPLSKGGPHRADNIAPSCARCNARKQARTPEQYLQDIIDDMYSDF